MQCSIIRIDKWLSSLACLLLFSWLKLIGCWWYIPLMMMETLWWPNITDDTVCCDDGPLACHFWYHLLFYFHCVTPYGIVTIAVMILFHYSCSLVTCIDDIRMCSKYILFKYKCNVLFSKCGYYFWPVMAVCTTILLRNISLWLRNVTAQTTACKQMLCETKSSSCVMTIKSRPQIH